VNQFDNSLYSFSLGANGTAPTSVTVTPIPVPATCSDPEEEFYPFALKFFDGQLYVGGTCFSQWIDCTAFKSAVFGCTANGSGDETYTVFQFDPATGFLPAPVVENGLNYARTQGSEFWISDFPTEVPVGSGNFIFPL